MNHNFNADEIRRIFSGKKRKPLRTIAEIACELGINQRVLSGKLGHYKSSPKPKLDNRKTSISNPVLWYDRDEVIAWWKSHQEQREKSARATSLTCHEPI
jgi:hypothetical protein